MARTVTFANLKEAIRVRADLPAFSTTTFVTTSSVNAMTNASLQRLYALLMACYGENYFQSTANVTATANTATSSLPTRCLKVRKLWWVRGTDDLVEVCRGNADDVAISAYAAKTWDEYGPKYQLQGTASILWLPKPSATYTVLCDHIALPADLSADGDTFEAGSSWEEYVVADVCRKIAIKEEKDPSVHMADRAECEAQIRETAAERVEGEAQQLRDAWGGHDLSAYALRNALSQRY